MVCSQHTCVIPLYNTTYKWPFIWNAKKGGMEMFEEKTFDTILDEMLSMIPDNVDRREGSMIYDALAPCAFRLAEAYAALTELSDALLPTKAKGDYLEALGTLWNVRREPATYAKFYLK